jgi:hypothetical protein
MSKDGAVLIERLITLLMGRLDVVPELLPVSIAIVGILINTYLSQILHQNLLSSEFTISTVHCAVFSSTEAVLIDVLIITIRAVPKDKVRCHENLGTEPPIDLHEVMDEVKSNIIAA